MANKSFQEMEEAMTPRPPTPSSLHRHEDNSKMGEQEAAAARTIMMLSSNREKEKLQHHHQQHSGPSIYVPPDYVPTYFKVTSSPGVPAYQHHRHHPSEAYPPSLFDVVAKDQSYVQKSREMGHKLPRLPHDAKPRYHKHQSKKSRDHYHTHQTAHHHPVVSGKDPFQSIPITKPYTAPRRGRPKKSAT